MKTTIGTLNGSPLLERCEDRCYFSTWDELYIMKYDEDEAERVFSTEDKFEFISPVCGCTCAQALNRGAGAKRRQHLAIRMKYRRGWPYLTRGVALTVTFLFLFFSLSLSHSRATSFLYLYTPLNPPNLNTFAFLLVAIFSPCPPRVSTLWFSTALG